MTLLSTYPFSSTFANSVNPGLQANGVATTGNSSPNGIGSSLSIANGAMRARVKTGNLQTVGGTRSECYFSASSLATENWYTWQALINQADWDSTGQCSIAQVHSLDSLNTAVNFLLLVISGELQLYLPNVAPPSIATTYKAVASVPFVFDTWNSFCLHALWENDGTGFMEFYFNNQIIYKNWAFANAYNADAPYLKLGIYDAFAGNDFGQKTAYYKNLNLYSGNIGYETALGGTPQPSQLLIY